VRSESGSEDGSGSGGMCGFWLDAGMQEAGTIWLGVTTERERPVQQRGLPVYRCIFKKYASCERQYWRRGNPCLSTFFFYAGRGELRERCLQKYAYT
jgi:hypothetical protein